MQSSGSSRSSSGASGGRNASFVLPYISLLKDKEYRDMEHALHGGMHGLAANLHAAIGKNERNLHALSTILGEERQRLESIRCKYCGRLLSSLVRRVNREEVELLLLKEVCKVSPRMFDLIISARENIK